MALQLLRRLAGEPHRLSLLRAFVASPPAPPAQLVQLSSFTASVRGGALPALALARPGCYVQPATPCTGWSSPTDCPNHTSHLALPARAGGGAGGLRGVPAGAAAAGDAR